MKSYDLNNKTKYDGDIIKLAEDVMIKTEKQGDKKILKFLKLNENVYEIMDNINIDEKFFKDKLLV